MNFKTVEPYLPTLVLALKTVWEGYGVKFTDAKSENAYGQAKRTLLDTALAVGGCFLAAKYGNRLGVAPMTALLGAAAIPGSSVAHFAAAGYFLCVSAQEGLAAGKAKDMVSVVKNAACVSLAYLSTTQWGAGHVSNVYKIVTLAK